MSRIFLRELYIIICLIVIVQGCSSGGSDSGGPGVPAGLSNYVGTWEASCTANAPTLIYTLSISSDGQYWLVEREYSAAATCGDDNSLDNTKITTAIVSDIVDNSANNLYQDLFLTVSKTRITPFSTIQVSNWISAAYCGKTDWGVNGEASFDSNNSGNGCHQDTTRPAVQLNGANLSMNGRGGFDGADPPEIIYTKQSDNPLLTGKIGGIPWMAISGTAKELFTPGEYFYVLYDSYIPNVCSAVPNNKREVLFSTPVATGNYTLSFNTTLTFFDGQTNHISVNGSINIATLTAAQVTGNINAVVNGSNSGSGDFSAAICPP